MRFTKNTPQDASKVLRLPRKMTMDASKVLRLPRKLQHIFWKRRKSIAPATQNDLRHVAEHVWMSRSATPATRNEAARRLKPPKRTTSVKLPIGTAIRSSRERLRTVANGCARERNVERTHPQPPDPQSETGTLATHSGNIYRYYMPLIWYTHQKTPCFFLVGIDRSKELKAKRLKELSDLQVPFRAACRTKFRHLKSPWLSYFGYLDDGFSKWYHRGYHIHQGVRKWFDDLV